MINKAIDAIEGSDVTERLLESMTLTIDSAKLKAVCELAEEFRKKVARSHRLKVAMRLIS